MSDVVFGLIADYGVIILFCITFLSCLAVPLPSSLAMLAAGGFAATGDLQIVSVALAAFCGAVLGDNLGYWLARGMGSKLSDWLSARPGRAKLRGNAEAYMEKHGGSAIFFSCWLVAPLGPTMNYISGLIRFRWHQFAMWGFAGEIVWVTIYVGLGYLFADNLTEVSRLLGNLSGFVAAGVITAGLGYWLYRATQKRHQTPA